MGLGELITAVLFNWNVFTLEGKMASKAEAFAAALPKDAKVDGNVGKESKVEVGEEDDDLFEEEEEENNEGTVGDDDDADDDLKNNEDSTSDSKAEIAEWISALENSSVNPDGFDLKQWVETGEKILFKAANQCVTPHLKQMFDVPEKASNAAPLIAEIESFSSKLDVALDKNKNKLSPVDFLDQACARLQLLSGRKDPTALLLSIANDQIQCARLRIFGRNGLLAKYEDRLKAPISDLRQRLVGSEQDRLYFTLPLKEAIGTLLSAAPEGNVHALLELVNKPRSTLQSEGDNADTQEGVAPTDNNNKLRCAYGFLEDFCRAVKKASDRPTIIAELKVLKDRLIKELEQWASLLQTLTQTVTTAQANGGLMTTALMTDSDSKVQKNILDEVADLLDKLSSEPGHDLAQLLMAPEEWQPLGKARGPLGLLDNLPEKYPLLIELADAVLPNDNGAVTSDISESDGVLKRVFDEQLCSTSTKNPAKPTFFHELSIAEQRATQVFVKLRGFADAPVHMQLVHTLQVGWVVDHK